MNAASHSADRPQLSNISRSEVRFVLSHGRTVGSLRDGLICDLPSASTAPQTIGVPNKITRLDLQGFRKGSNGPAMRSGLGKFDPSDRCPANA